MPRNFVKKNIRFNLYILYNVKHTRIVKHTHTYFNHIPSIMPSRLTNSSNTATESLANLADMSEEEREKLREQIKKVEDGILEKINTYNRDLKDYVASYEEFRTIESKALNVSNKIFIALKSKKSFQDLEKKYEEYVDQVNEKRASVFDTQRDLFTQLQVLYKEHTDYLSQIANGLKNRCDQLTEQLKNVESHEKPDRTDNV